MNIRIGELSGSDATNALHKTILDHNEVSTRQTRQILFLTYAMLLLTAVMTLLVAVQIWLALRQTPDSESNPTTQSIQNPHQK